MLTLKQLFAKMSRKVRRHSQAPTQRRRLTLEVLEDRVLLASYLWTGASGTDLNWSTAANWQVGGFIAKNAPTATDDLVFNNTGARNSVVDANFGGTVKSIDIDKTFANIITLNESLTVTSLAEIDGGAIAGNNNLNIGDPQPPIGNPRYAAVLNWKGGTLGGGTASYVYINSLSTANISGAAVKTEDGRMFYSYGTVNWTGGGNILLKDAAQFEVAGTMNANLTAAAIIDGNGEAHTAFYILAGGTFNFNPQQGATGNLFLRASLGNQGTVNIDQGNISAYNSTVTTGRYTIASGCELDSVGTSTFTLDGSAGTCVISGLGQVYFGTSTHVQIIGTVNVGNVLDSSNLLDDTANSTLIVNGTYQWNGGTWAGSGVTQIGTNTNSSAVLNLAGNYAGGFALQRQVVNYGTITWTATQDIKVSNGGSITNKPGSLFDVQTGQTITNSKGAGNFTNGGTLQKSAGAPAFIDLNLISQAGSRIVDKTSTLNIDLYASLLGSVTVDAGATLAFDGGMEQDAGGTITDSGTITVAGDFDENAGTVALLSGTIVANNIDVAAGAVLSGSGTVTANVANAGEIDVAASDTLTVSGAYTQSAGVTNVNSGAILSVAGALDQQGGVLNLLGANLHIDQGYTVESAATLNASGLITANFVNAGTLVVGGPNSIGSLNFGYDSRYGITGSFTQTSTGVLDVEVAGQGESDTLNATGAITFGGTLNVAFLDGYVPKVGDELFVMHGLSSGAFSAVNQPYESDGAFVVKYNQDDMAFDLLFQGG